MDFLGLFLRGGLGLGLRGKSEPLSLASDVNALTDQTGERAHRHQQGPVWFLAGVINESGTVHRQIVIAEGKHLFLPVLNAECSTVEAPPWYGADEAAMRTCAQGWMDIATNLYFELDGQTLPNLASHRTNSPLFSFELPANNILGVPGPTNGLAVSDGFWVMLRPLPQGAHTLQFRGTLPGSPDFNLNVTYDIVVRRVSLAFETVGNQLRLSWTTPGFVLQHNADLSNPEGWTDLPAANGSALIPLSEPSGFYRLRQP